MRKFVCLLLVFVFCGHAVYAMNLDGIKARFLKGEWKDGIREGESLLANAKRNSPDLDQLYYYLALCYMKDRNYLRTSDICEIILKEFPSSKFVPQAHYVLIDAYAGSGNMVAARSLTEAFLKKYPGSEHTQELQARLRQFKGYASEQSIEKAHVPEAVVSASDPDIVLAADVVKEKAQKVDDDSFWIQVGAFSSERNAGNLAVKLRAVSYNAVVCPAMSKGRSIYKVRVGPYASMVEAMAVSRKLSRQGYPTKVIP